MGENLSSTTIYRGGCTKLSMSPLTSRVSLEGASDQLVLRFTTPAGAGYSDFGVYIGLEDFPKILEGMLKLSGSTLLPIMAKAVAAYLSNLRENEERVRHEGRLQVQDLAARAQNTADGDVAKVVFNRVVRFVNALRSPPKPAVPATPAAPTASAPVPAAPQPH
jgi:hypothetical protein